MTESRFSEQSSVFIDGKDAIIDVEKLNDTGVNEHLGLHFDGEIEAIGADALLELNPSARRLYAAMLQRGATPEFAKNELTTSVLVCLWHARRDGLYRLESVWRSLAAGRSCAELFGKEPAGISEK